MESLFPSVAEIFLLIPREPGVASSRAASRTAPVDVQRELPWVGDNTQSSCGATSLASLNRSLFHRERATACARLVDSRRRQAACEVAGEPGHTKAGAASRRSDPVCNASRCRWSFDTHAFASARNVHKHLDLEASEFSLPTCCGASWWTRGRPITSSPLLAPQWGDAADVCEWNASVVPGAEAAVFSDVNSRRGRQRNPERRPSPSCSGIGKRRTGS